jgi:hypothetical protein
MQPIYLNGHAAGSRRPWPAVLVALVALPLFLSGCGATGAQDAASGELTRPQQYGGPYVGGTATGDTEAGAAFARWVLEQDPERRYITDAVVRNEQTVGVKVQPNIAKGDVQRLLVSLTEGMARTFPDRPVKAIAFYQSGDKLAEASYEPTSNRVDFRFL